MGLPEWAVPIGWIAGPVITGLIGVLIGNRNRRFEARRELEASVMKAGPDIIDRLSAEISKLWLELRSTQGDLRTTQVDLRTAQNGERECRDELWALKQRIGRIDGQDS